MFSELSKLFGRDFAVGFLLPVVIFLASSSLLFHVFVGLDTSSYPLRLFQSGQEFLGATMLAFILWMGGILLLALNRSIIRMKEGYGKWNPARIFRFVEQGRFEKLQKRLYAIDNYIEVAEGLGEQVDPSLTEERSTLTRRAVERFPHSAEYLLPTAFGNTIRAFESYSSVMYGLDAIPAWSRLLMVMPDNDRELVDTAKSQMSFWVNTWLLGLIFLAEYVILTIVTGERGHWWALASLLLAWLASVRARSAAAMWGGIVKASFDVYMPALRKKLELDNTLDREGDKQQWTDISIAMIYRDPDYLPRRCPPNTSEK